MVLVWWVYVIIVVALFLSFLLGHILLRKLNETRLEDRLNSRHERVTVSAQTSWILDKNTKIIDSKNLKEDKRTSKSLSLVFSKDKSLAHTNLQELLTDDSRGKKLHDKGRKSDPSTNIEKELSSFTTAFSATSSSKNWSKVCMQDVPNSDLRLIKNVSSTKGDVSFGKSDELIKCKESINDVLPPSVTYNKSVHNNKESFTPKVSHTWSMKFDKKEHENVKEFITADDNESTENVLPLQDNITKQDNNKQPTPKAYIDDVFKSLINSKVKGFLTYKASHKDITSISVKNEKTDDENVLEFVTTDDSTKYLMQTIQTNRSIHNNRDLLTPRDSHKDMKPIITGKESIDTNNTANIVLPSPEDDTTIILNNVEIITPKDSHKGLKPALKNNEDVGKGNKQLIKPTDSSKGILSSFKVDTHESEFVKAKDSVLNMLKFDESINLNFEEVHRNKDCSKIVISSLSDNAVKDESSKIIKEPSSLFSNTLTCTPVTPKEMFEPYERALASSKSSKSDTCYSTSLRLTESKHATDGSSLTSRSKSICDIKRSKDNVITSVSRVIFNPETKTSYIKVLDDPTLSKPETGITKISRTSSKLNELSQIKDNVSKCTSRVTFAKNEIVITDSASIVDHVCVVTPPTAVLVNDCETTGSNEFDIESASNESTTESKDDTKENTSSTFKRNFINESVAVTNSIYRPCRNETLGNVKDKYDYDIEASRISSNSHCEKKSEKKLVCSVGSFNTKLLECLSAVIKDEASTSRSLSIAKNEASTSSNNDYPEVVIINNKFSGDTESSCGNQYKTEENVDELKKAGLETKDKEEALLLEMLEGLDLKLEQDDTQSDERNKNNDDNARK